MEFVDSFESNREFKNNNNDKFKELILIVTDGKNEKSGASKFQF